MAKPGIKKLLNEILSDDLENVYIHITTKAAEWAGAGFVEEANNLLEQLWSLNIPHSKNVWLQDEAFQVIWELSGKQPKNIPFTFKHISEIENEKPVGYTLMHPAVGASLLAARMNRKDKAEYFIKLWGKGYLEYWSNSDIAYLMRDRATALLLLKGLLAPIFGITTEICQKEIQEILEKLSQRITHGRTLAYKQLSWKQLLNKISKLAIGQNSSEIKSEFIAKKSLSRAPATISEIAEIEKKLNVIFPDDYKNFLLTSNGFECFSSIGVTLAPIEKVDFLTSVDKELVDIWTDAIDDTNADFNEKLKSSIIIGGHEEEQQLLLIPLKNDDWECWHFSSWQPGEVVYQSFRFYMEHELQELEDGLYKN